MDHAEKRKLKTKGQMRAYIAELEKQVEDDQDAYRKMRDIMAKKLHAKELRIHELNIIINDLSGFTNPPEVTQQDSSDNLLVDESKEDYKLIVEDCTLEEEEDHMGEVNGIIEEQYRKEDILNIKIEDIIGSNEINSTTICSSVVISDGILSGESMNENTPLPLWKSKLIQYTEDMPKLLPAFNPRLLDINIDGSNNSK